MKHVAYFQLKSDPVYRAEAFKAGLEKADYIVNLKEPRHIKPGDVLVLWNLSGTNETYANGFEKAGGTVIVCENGYIGSDSDNRQYYAIAKHGHNGSGEWYIGGPERLQKLGITLKPWRTQGHHILVCPNRYIGSKQMRMPADWVQKTVAELESLTNLPIRVRHHPGNWQKTPPKIPLERDLEGAYAVVTWASTAGVKALAEGIPVFYGAPHWICEISACYQFYGIRDPLISDRPRLEAFERLAWAQWSVAEITTGEPFRCLQQI